MAWAPPAVPTPCQAGGAPRGFTPAWQAQGPHARSCVRNHAQKEVCKDSHGAMHGHVCTGARRYERMCVCITHLSVVPHLPPPPGSCSISHPGDAGTGPFVPFALLPLPETRRGMGQGGQTSAALPVLQPGTAMGSGWGGGGNAPTPPCTQEGCGTDPRHLSPVLGSCGARTGAWGRAPGRARGRGGADGFLPYQALLCLSVCHFLMCPTRITNSDEPRLD